eukprot:1146302-Pelagomonas_calceolata.AAC.1
MSPGPEGGPTSKIVAFCQSFRSEMAPKILILFIAVGSTVCVNGAHTVGREERPQSFAGPMSTTSTPSLPCGIMSVGFNFQRRLRRLPCSLLSSKMWSSNVCCCTMSNLNLAALIWTSGLDLVPSYRPRQWLGEFPLPT